MNHNHNASASDVFGSSADIELNSLHDAEEKLAETGSIHSHNPDTFTAATSSKDATTINASATDYDVFWTENDPENPMNWPGGQKWGILILISVFTFITPLASSMFVSRFGSYRCGGKRRLGTVLTVYSTGAWD